MLANLQRFIAIFLLCAAVGWAYGFATLSRPGWAAAGVMLIFGSYAIFLGAEFVILYFVQTNSAAPRPTIRQLIFAWWRECLTAPRVFLWHQPFRVNTEPDFLPEDSDDHRGVVLVHGFVCNRGIWNPWMRVLRKRGVPFVAVSLEPLFGSIDAYIDLIETAVSRIEASTKRSVVLVGHSMGGMAIRAWYARRDNHARVHRIITIGSPHGGTWLARFGQTTNGRQMRIGSPWLFQLATRETVEHYARFTCFFSHCDNIVFPAGSGTLPDAQNIHVPGAAHVDMIFQPQVFEETCRWLD